jgi:hypothetical protein
MNKYIYERALLGEEFFQKLYLMAIDNKPIYKIYSFSYYIAQNKAKTIIEEKNNIIIDRTQIIQNLIQDSLELDSLHNSTEFKRFSIYKETNIFIPKIPKEHLLEMIRCQHLYNIPKKIYYNLIYTESKFINNLTSVKGAKGYMQLMPNTKISLSGRSDIEKGSKFLRMLRDKYNSWEKALSFYNGGYKGISDPSTETKEYLIKILN